MSLVSIRPLVRTAAALLVGLHCLPGPAVTLEVVDPPTLVAPGQTIPVDVRFSKPSTVTERRLVFFLELHRRHGKSLLSKSILDNNGLGYTATTGTLTFPVTVPPETTGTLYFKAWAVPWSLNRAVVQRYQSYPTDGTWTYLWSGGGYGVTQNVYYLGTLICPKPAGNTTYCSGLAFEAGIVSFHDYNALYGHSTIGGLTVTQMQDFRRVWYGVTDAEKLAARAIPEYGLGVEITDFEEAQDGDFVQLWRWSGSGHNPLFVDWARGAGGEITGVRYWGTQPSTNGIGYRTEYFGTSGSTMRRSRFYIGRLRKPRDRADYDWALGTTSTKETVLSTTATDTTWHRPRPRPTGTEPSGVLGWEKY